MDTIPKIEEKILKFWKKNKIFEKSLKKNNKKKFVFFEGPPTANGKPGMHHVEARAFKDVIPRYKTMRGFFVDRKAGWDTHGLPVELEVEKELGFKNKEDIEKYGIAKFNQKCKTSVWKYKNEWEKITERIAFWIDIKDPYITYEDKYIESVWYILKRIWDKGLLFKGFKIVPYCSRCGTVLSSHEVSQGYQNIEENSVYLNFKVTNGNNKVKKNDIILAWTTTPWTLPGNVALAIGEKIDYVKINYQDKKYILAKSRLGVIDGEYKIEDEFKGKDLIDVEYSPLFNIKSIKNSDKKAYYVISADFVSTEDGTGVVHIAPMYGEDDYEIGKKVGLPEIHTVTDNGFFTEDLADYGLLNKFVKDKEIENKILNYLKENELLFKEEKYRHDYPFCWRCDTPLIYYAKESWFIGMSKLRKNLVANNRNIFWEPSHIKNGRFGEFIKEARDWALSRERYWGTPLPIWECEKCGEVKCIGSAKELGKKVKELHRPYVDDIKLKCKCGGDMIRDKSVIDCWFDSGAMPFAQWGYPYLKDSKKKFKEYYPADYICEAIDQTRGWFYSLLAIATLMEYIGEIKQGHCFNNVICLGHVLDSNGKKMSKSKGNVVDPWEICNKFGADSLRWYLYTVNQAGEPKRFNIKDIIDKNRRVFGTLFNSFVFFQTYKDKKFKPKKIKSKNILDKWIISKFNLLNNSVVNSLEKYDIVSAARLIESFIDELSNWYIRRSRTRLQKSKNKEEKEEASQTLYRILFDISKLIAPFAPFMAEEIYRNLRTNKDLESVHLCDYPKPNKKLIDKQLELRMEKVREIVVLALAERAKKGIKTRQPLKSLTINNKTIVESKELTDLIKEEVNVKEVIFGKNVKLDIKITNELKIEGMIRDLIRFVQGMRKDGGLKPGQKICLHYSTSSKLNEIILKHQTEIQEEVTAKKIESKIKEKEVFLAEKEVELDGQKIWIGIRK